MKRISLSDDQAHALNYRRCSFLLQKLGGDLLEQIAGKLGYPVSDQPKKLIRRVLGDVFLGNLTFPNLFCPLSFSEIKGFCQALGFQEPHSTNQAIATIQNYVAFPPLCESISLPQAVKRKIVCKTPSHVGTFVSEVLSCIYANREHSISLNLFSIVGRLGTHIPGVRFPARLISKE